MKSPKQRKKSSGEDAQLREPFGSLYRRNVDPPIAICTKQMAGRIGVCVATLYNRPEEFPKARKIGGRRLYFLADIEAWERKILGDIEAA